MGGTGVIVLGSDGVIRWSSDLVTWTVVATAPTTARSVTYLNRILYVGTTNSQVLAASVPLP
jgi:hypothetical protein